MFKLMVKKISQFYTNYFCLTGPMFKLGTLLCKCLGYTHVSRADTLERLLSICSVGFTGLSMLSNFVCFLSSADFFKKIFQEYRQSVKQYDQDLNCLRRFPEDNIRRQSVKKRQPVWTKEYFKGFLPFMGIPSILIM